MRTGVAPSYRAPLDSLQVESPVSGAIPGDFPVLPGYEIVDEVGRGGMGVVYRARQTSLDRWVAIKMIHAAAAGDPAARSRFRTEAEAVARLQHPNVIQIFEVGEYDGRPFLALEFLPGGSLHSGADSNVRPEREAAQLVEVVARAVHHAHQHGILHRDMKPANVLLTSDGTPKVTDFGLAKMVDRNGSLTQTEAVIGTPSYMAPEQAAGDAKRTGITADVYSLGALLYELLTGQAPFRGLSPLNTLEQVRTREPAPPRRLRNGVSPDLETICLRCLEKQPEGRYPTADALADDLARFLSGEPIRARPVPVWRRFGRAVQRRPAMVARAACVTALTCVLLAGGSYLRNADQMARQRAEDRYQKFAGLRNEALFYGLIAPDEGAVFRGGGTSSDWSHAEAAAREALRVAGVDPDAMSPTVDRSFTPHRRPAVVADCYTLLLVLAGARSQQPAADSADHERQQEAIRLLDCAGKLGIESRALHERRATVLTRLGRRDEARDEEERARASPPDGTLDQFLIGEELYRRGEWAQARNAFHRVLAAQPGHFWGQ
ncbi:MAG TPA: serine/threonine-protein kinase, partial [Gemmataceae bacterium]|nr:serine/threonine-protein kinase [Gemmataceae bacterium]